MKSFRIRNDFLTYGMKTFRNLEFAKWFHTINEEIISHAVIFWHFFVSPLSTII